ncbi:MAG: hypothetical protein WAV18_07135 [Roseiarcus sp.]
MTSNDVSVAMGRRIKLGEDHPAVGGGWLEVMAAPLPRTPFNDDVAVLDRTCVTRLVVVAAGQESTIVQENQRFMAYHLTVRTRSHLRITRRRGCAVSRPGNRPRGGRAGRRRLTASDPSRGGRQSLSRNRANRRRRVNQPTSYKESCDVLE